VNIFEKVSILQLVTDNDYTKLNAGLSNQLNLFD